MNKVVFNDCYGGYGLSEIGLKRYCELTKQNPKEVSEYDIDRHDPFLIQVVQELGAKAEGHYSKLVIAEIPGCEYRISEYDGWESVEYPEMDQNWILIDTKENREKYPEKFL